MIDAHTPDPDTTVTPPVAPVPRQRRERGEPKVFDASVVSTMFAGIAPTRVARDYLITYRALTPGRIAGVLEAAEGADPARLLEEVLSLKVTAQMAGAEQLAAHAERLEEYYRAGDSRSLAAALSELPEAGRRVEAAISELLGE